MTVSASLFADDGTRLSFERSGAGPGTICFVPSHPFSARAVHAIPALDAALTRLAERYTVLIIETRGAGRAEHRPPYTLANMAEDILTVVQESGSRGCVLWGHRSAGIAVAMAAKRRPDLIGSVVLDGPFTTDAYTALLGGDRPAIYTRPIGEIDDILYRAVSRTIDEWMELAPESLRDAVLTEARASAPAEAWLESLAATTVFLRKSASVDPAIRFRLKQPLATLLPPAGLGGPPVEQLRAIAALNSQAIRIEGSDWWHAQHNADAAGPVVAALTTWINHLAQGAAA